MNCNFKINKSLYKLLLTFIFLCLVTFGIYYFQNKPLKEYKVIQIVQADKLYIDFNNNDKADADELVKLSAINSLRPSFSDVYKEQLEYIGIDKPSGFLVGNLANNYARENLLYKKVKVKIVKEKINPEQYGYQFAQIYLNDKDWGTILLQKGFATVYRKSVNARKYLKYENTYLIKENAKQELAKNYVIVNVKTQKYHKLTCPYGQMTKRMLIIKESELSSIYQKCKFCHKPDNAKSDNKNFENSVTSNNFKTFDITSGVVSIYFTDFTKHLKPSTNLIDENSIALLKLLNSAKTSIDIAAYGLDDNEHIINALLNAQKRGVKIRIVADKNAKNESPYKTTKLEQKFSTKIVYDCKETDNKTFKNMLMHNKFIIVDNSIVYTGSMNFANNDLSGYNSNISIIIRSSLVAQIYKQEFEQMYKGNFHKYKIKLSNKENIILDNNNTVSIYFSPKDRTIDTQLIPLINNAKKYIYVPVFSLTNKELMDALITAKKRSVDVRVIADAANISHGKFSPNYLRTNAIPVKCENYAGKMHMKSIIIDDTYIITGSMNFSNAGQNKNDENTIILKNPILAKKFKEQFLYTYSKIDNKWLQTNPAAESWYSIGSCNDGVDNDFDGKIDANDNGCHTKNIKH